MTIESAPDLPSQLAVKVMHEIGSNDPGLYGRIQETLNAALAPAPQPAPERESGRAEGWAEAARFLETLKGTDLDGNEFDLPADEWRVTALLGVRACADKLDALLARGLRLPGETTAEAYEDDLVQRACENVERHFRSSVVVHETPVREQQDALTHSDETQAAPETMAWAVVGESGEIELVYVGHDRRDLAEMIAEGTGRKPVRVVIRVVEGGDDAA